MNNSKQRELSFFLSENPRVTKTYIKSCIITGNVNLLIRDAKKANLLAGTMCDPGYLTKSYLNLYLNLVKSKLRVFSQKCNTNLRF